MKKDKTFRPDRVLSYFKAEWLPLAFVTLSGLVYNIGLLATPWFEGRLVQCLADILGGSETADPFREFLDLTVEAFLCIRKYWSEISSLVNCMADSGLPCFLPDTLTKLKNRFTPELSESQAAQGMLVRVGECVVWDG